MASFRPAATGGSEGLTGDAALRPLAGHDDLVVNTLSRGSTCQRTTSQVTLSAPRDKTLTSLLTPLSPDGDLPLRYLISPRAAEGRRECRRVGERDANDRPLGGRWS